MVENRLVFVEEGHKYFRVNEPDKPWTSVTTVVKEYSEPFKRDEWLAYKAIERTIGEKKMAEIKKGVTEDYGGFNYHVVMERSFPLADFESFSKHKEEIEEEWNREGLESSAKGTAGHLEFELASYERGREVNLMSDVEFIVPPRPDFEYDNEQIAASLAEIEDGYYPELLIWYEIDDERRICGQSDGVFIWTEDDGRHATIRDYKFVKQNKMNTQNFCSVSRRGVTMKEPISHLPCSKIHGYQLQMSIYGWMMQQSGYKIDHIWLDHINEKGRKKIIPLDYLEEEAGLVVNDFLFG